MDKRTLLALVLCTGVYFAYYMFFVRPGEGEISENDVAALIGSDDAGSGSDIVQTDGGSDAGSLVDVPALPTLLPVVPSTVPDVVHSMSACQATSSVVSNGGYLRDISLDEWEAPYEVVPIYMWVYGLVTGGDTTWHPYGEPPGVYKIATDQARFLGMGSGDLATASSADVQIEEIEGGILVRGMTTDGIIVERRITVNGLDPCMLNVKATWQNPKSTPYNGPVWLQIHDTLPDATNAYAKFNAPYWSIDGSWNSYTYPKTGGYLGLYAELDKPVLYEGKVDWFGMSDGYFSFVVVTGAEAKGALWLSPIDVGAEESQYGHHYVFEGLAAGQTISEDFQVYLGHNDTTVLDKISPNLGKLVDLGWFAFFGQPLRWLLRLYFGFVGVWGWSIILLTVTVKMVFFPLTQMAYKSSQRMQALQPRLKAVKEKYADNQEELNRQTMALFKENKVNPIGGCLPMLIQMPIWIALYRVLLTSVDLYHEQFLYLQDLSVADPYCILPVIVVGLMFLQQQFMPTGNMDPNQARIMKMMPLFMGFLFFSFPSGLVLYILVNMLLTILQQWVIKRRFKTESPAEAPAAAGQQGGK
jgi:YidC/Oxa1 family membrane protein insertase